MEPADKPPSAPKRSIKEPLESPTHGNNVPTDVVYHEEESTKVEPTDDVEDGEWAPEEDEEEDIDSELEECGEGEDHTTAPEEEEEDEHDNDWDNDVEVEDEDYQAEEEEDGQDDDWDSDEAEEDADYQAKDEAQEDEDDYDEEDNEEEDEDKPHKKRRCLDQDGVQEMARAVHEQPRSENQVLIARTTWTNKGCGLPSFRKLSLMTRRRRTLLQCHLMVSVGPRPMNSTASKVTDISEGVDKDNDDGNDDSNDGEDDDSDDNDGEDDDSNDSDDGEDDNGNDSDESQDDDSNDSEPPSKRRRVDVSSENGGGPGNDDTA
nr:glutamic acid-rich protein-like [Setaria viridis]